MVLMGVGYALLAQTLTINATASINSTWDIEITNVEVKGTPIGYAENDSENTGIGTDKVSANLSANFKAPGDSITYEITVENLGTIPAEIKTTVITPIPNVNDVIQVSHTADEVEALKNLQPTDEGKFTVTLTFNENVTELPTASIRNYTAQKMTETNKTYSFTIMPTFEQKTPISNGNSSSGGTTPTPVGTCDTGEINLGGECFHIISDEGDSYTLLAKYNLLVGNTITIDDSWNVLSNEPISSSTQGYGLQSPNAKFESLTSVGTLAFSNNMYWQDNERNLFSPYDQKSEYVDSTYPVYVYDSNSNLYGVVNNYKSYLQGLGYNINEARLMKYSEAIELGCVPDGEGPAICPTGSEENGWVSTTTYWLGSADITFSSVWCVFDGQVMVGDYSTLGLGIRPVIEILKSEVNS